MADYCPEKKYLMTKIIKQCVGIDMSMDDFKVCLKQKLEGEIEKIKGSRTFNNNVEGLADFVMWTSKRITTGAPLSL